ncbi:metalloprotease family protein [Halomicrobium sp. LC1Hm]|uniref:metalloprotease family protein n=1 Tax=Halomicrobium sp. LC1Hm TaxID=2610902 RepID=UPI0012983000|nr:metalloprotease family protein [Halomicrobium sp. LC1Hm]QGA84105.1 hypothetical protein LC1Hm_3079 [Halomicrobium sp. LC1Hm]
MNDQLNAPEGNTPYQRYSLPKWGLASVAVVLVIAGFQIVSILPIKFWTSNILHLLIAFGFTFTGSLFAHESLHYLTNSILGYEPVYLWPNKVYVPNVPISRQDIVLILLAPQLLSILYIALLLADLTPGLEIMFEVALIYNIAGGYSDLTWILRRLTWPRGTRVIVTKDQDTYVSFPEDYSQSQ